MAPRYVHCRRNAFFIGRPFRHANRELLSVAGATSVHHHHPQKSLKFYVPFDARSRAYRVTSSQFQTINLPLFVTVKDDEKARAFWVEF